MPWLSPGLNSGLSVVVLTGSGILAGSEMLAETGMFNGSGICHRKQIAPRERNSRRGSKMLAGSQEICGSGSITGSRILTGSGMVTRNNIARMLPGLYDTGTATAGADGARVIVHPPNVLPLPLEEGFDVPSGFSVSLGVRPKRNVRIGPPYGDCVDHNPLINATGTGNGRDHVTDESRRRIETDIRTNNVVTFFSRFRTVYNRRGRNKMRNGSGILTGSEMVKPEPETTVGIT